MTQTPELLPVEQSKILPCPFCRMLLSEPKPVLGSPELFRFHPGVVTDNDCVLSGRGFGEADLTAWNTRSHAIHEPASVMREEAAKVAEANAAISVPLMNGPGVSASVETGRYRAAIEIARDIRNLPLSDGVG